MRLIHRSSRSSPPASTADVRAFWDRASCGEVYAQGETARERFDRQAATRYALEPYLEPFAGFADGAGRDVLEVGVGMGADHLRWAQANPRSLAGVDLTPRAVELTGERLGLYACQSDLRVADVEQLPFVDASFDLIYSWGVLHHAANTPRAIREVHRVLRPGGQARVMIYQKHSIVGYLLWLRHALLTGRPNRTLDEIYAQHLESPGTKAYTVAEARQLFEPFRSVEIRTCLGMGDLLQGEVGQRHRGPLLRAVKAVYPRWLIRKFFRDRGQVLLISAIK